MYHKCLYQQTFLGQHASTGFCQGLSFWRECDRRNSKLSFNQPLAVQLQQLLLISSVNISSFK
jgi:hypothetical protein